MKKIIAILLSVIAIVLSVTAILISVKSLKVSQETNKVVNSLQESILSEAMDSQQSEIDKAIADYIAGKESEAVTEDVKVEEKTEETVFSEESSEEVSEEKEEEQVAEPQEEVYTFNISDEERQKRKMEQENIQTAREFLYTQPHTVENAYKINLYDKMMIENNTVDFTDKIITLVGDSITVGVGASTDENGNYRGYANKLNDTFHFEKFVNNSVGGWLYSTFAKEELSIVANKTDKIYFDSDIIIMYAGVNDFISESNEKRMGTYSMDTKSTAGFCGAFEEMCTFLNNYYSDKEIFIVLNYPVDSAGGGSYIVESEPHEYSDFMEAQKTIASRYGFRVIDLYSTGLIDGMNQDMKKSFLADNIHPNDEGHRMIGEHIAAEISFVIGNK